MAKPPRSHLRRNLLVFGGTLLVHAWVLGLVATRPIDPALAADDRPGSATPIEFVQPVYLTPKPTPAKKPKRVTPVAVAQVRAAQVASADPVRLADAGALEAPLAPLGGPSGGEDPIDLGGGPPTDLSQQTPTAGHYPINPGYWQVAEHWLLLSRTERYCVAPRNITQFMAAPCNHLYHCDYPVQSVADGKFHFSGVVWRHDERYNVHGGGAYSPTSLHLTASGAGHFHILPFAFNASLDGQFLGPDCPAAAKRIRQAETTSPPP